MTRAAVFLMIGNVLGFAAYGANSRRRSGLSGVLRTLSIKSYGGVLLGIAALGLVAFRLLRDHRSLRAPGADAEIGGLKQHTSGVLRLP